MHLTLAAAPAGQTFSLGKSGRGLGPLCFLVSMMRVGGPRRRQEGCSVCVCGALVNIYAAANFSPGRRSFLYRCQIAVWPRCYSSATGSLDAAMPPCPIGACRGPPVLLRADADGCGWKGGRLGVAGRTERETQTDDLPGGRRGRDFGELRPGRRARSPGAALAPEQPVVSR